MKNILIFSLVSILGCSVSVAQNNFKNSQVVAERGGVVLTLEDIDAALASIPSGDRAAVVAGNDRLQQILDTELLNKQMAELGREMKLPELPDVQKRITRAQNEQLAKVALERYVDGVKKQDFDVLAKEYYLTNPMEFSTPVTSVVQHILVRKTGRSASEVLLRVKEILGKIDQPDASFDALVTQYSDDASKSENGGTMTVAEPGVFVKPFEDAAHALVKAVDISAPVETEYGTHILRLVSREPSKSQPFEEVKESIVAKLESKYLDDVRAKLFSDLRSANPVFHEDMIEAVRKRYGELPKVSDPAAPPAPTVEGTK